MRFVSGFGSIYIIISTISLAIGIVAAIVGYRVRRQWGLEESAEKQNILEKQVYLVISLIGVGLILRLFLVPLWFITLLKLMPTIPGAMCLTGVHMASPWYGFSATALKFGLPVLYAFWLVMNYLDRRVKSQPFMLTKLSLLWPIVGLMFIESYIDLSFLLKFEPKPTACCASVFDVPRPGMPGVLTHSGWEFVVGFYIGLILLVVASFFIRRGENYNFRLLRYGIWLLLIWVPVSFLLALHTRLSPLFLQKPLHHCVFCLWQKTPDMLISTLLIIAGVWLLGCYLAIVSAKPYPQVKLQLAERLRRISGAGLWLLIAGGLILGVHILICIYRG
jgi:hypothetical protein